MPDTLLAAAQLLWSFDASLLNIVGLSLWVSLLALACGVLVGLPLGAWMATTPFAGRQAVVLACNTLMGLPSVLAGVLVYLALSRSGPLGHWGLLFTPWAMVLAQALLVTPLIAAVSRQIIADAWAHYAAEFEVFGITPGRRLWLLLLDCRHSLAVAVLTGLSRSMSEVGAAMIVGGNIEGFTRVMTTAIALETAKGDLPLSLALGAVLMSLILALNLAVQWLNAWTPRVGGRPVQG